MWCPALAGMLTLRLNGRSIADLGWKWGETKYQIRSWYIPFLYASIAYAIMWIFHFGAFGNPAYYDSYDQVHASGRSAVDFRRSGNFSLGTYGWFAAFPRARRRDRVARLLGSRTIKTTSFTATSLISGIVWSLWHYPILIYGDYNAGTPRGTAHCFTVMVISISFIFAWMRLKSGSLWTGGDSPRQPQPLYPGHIHSANTRHGEDEVVHRRVRLCLAAGGHRVRDLFLDEAPRIAGRTARKEGTKCRAPRRFDTRRFTSTFGLIE